MIKHFRVAGSLRAKIEDLGVKVPAVLRRAGLPPNFFEQPRILVSTERFHPGCIAALSTENFGEAIQHLARYKRLSVPEEILQEMDDEEWRIQFHWMLAVEVEPHLLIEHCFAWVLTIARHGSGTRISPVRLELVQPRSHELFGAGKVCRPATGGKFIGKRQGNNHRGSCRPLTREE